MDHGGNIHMASRKTGIPEKRIIDFSASINPLGMPVSARLALRRQFSLLGHYPEPFAEGLSEQLGHMLGVDLGSIICGNGSTELIYLIPRTLKPRHVLITAPTFSEYEKACRNNGHELQVTSYKLQKENNFDVDADGFIEAIEQQNSRAAEQQGENATELLRYSSNAPINLAFICNPNNPTGRLLRKKDVLKIADAAKRLGCYLVVDEAFIDFCPDESVAHEVAGNPFLIVLRSLTKFYALAGLRLGYGIFPHAVAEMLKRQKEPWTVNSLAQAAGKASIKDLVYQESSLAVIQAEKEFMENEFEKISVHYLPSAANYYLLQLENAQQVIRALEEKGILVRDCSNFDGLDRTYIRVAVRSRRENTRLIREVRRICGA